ncbi:hypothetical protein ACQP25_06700 [Microtetraspora malaysiensis]|uniref:hypothetical protein n=1 Tax=Microtetraspora malaysiensis TaxID=161358 RepID=UPI003D94F3B6
MLHRVLLASSACVALAVMAPVAASAEAFTLQSPATVAQADSAAVNTTHSDWGRPGGWGRPASWGRPGGGYWGRSWGGSWGRPWGNPWGGYWGRPWSSGVVVVDDCGLDYYGDFCF